MVHFSINSCDILKVEAEKIDFDIFRRGASSMSAVF